MAKSPEEIAASMISNLPEKTGRSLSEWKPLVANCGFEKHGQAVKWLKEEHGVGHGFANLIVTMSRREESAEEVDLIAAQYMGKKAHLRPIYDAFEERLNTIGSDIEFSPKKAYVSLRRNKQFATVGPATNSALEVGINLKGAAYTGRLVKGTGMVTHRVRLSSLEELDDELFGWVRSAYDAS